MLRDVRQRLLHDAVERRLDLRREAGQRRGVASTSTAIPVCSAERLCQPLERRYEAEVVERLGRSSTARRRTLWSVSTTCSRSSAAAARAASAVSASSTRFRPSRIEVSAWPVSSWSSRASRRALELLPLDHPAERVAGDPVGEVDGHGCARGEGLGQAQLLVGEAGVGAATCCARRSRRSPGRRRSAARTARSAGPCAGRAPDRPRHRRGSSRRARCGAARARGRSSTRSRPKHVPTEALRRRARPPPRFGGRRPRLEARSRRARRRSACGGRVAIRSSSGRSSVSPASALPTSVSDSSCASQRVADS